MTKPDTFQEGLHSSEEKFRNLAETAADAIISADDQGNITYFNRAAERAFSYSSSEIIGQPLSMLMPERFRALHLQGFARYLKTGDARMIGKTVEMAGQRKDGTEFPVTLSLSSWETAEGIFFTGILSDITERKRAEQDILLRTAQLEVANQELEAFSYSVSHDLRAPLRAIDGFSQALVEDCGDALDPQGKDYLERIRAAAQHMATLIDDLLNLARITRAEIRQETIDLSGLAGTIAEDLKKRQPAREVEFVIAPGLQAEGDPQLLRLVLENMLDNAWKFTSRRAHARIEFGLQESSGTSTYFIRDNGAGFDPAYAGRLFGAFQRLHSMAEFPGTGVGLATVQRIIRRHGGRVWAESAVNQGATFYFSLGA